MLLSHNTVHTAVLSHNTVHTAMLSHNTVHTAALYLNTVHTSPDKVTAVTIWTYILEFLGSNFQGHRFPDRLFVVLNIPSRAEIAQSIQ